MRRIADDGLVKVPDLDIHASIGTGNRAEITDVAIPANPDRGSFGQRSALLLLKPLVEFDRAAADIGVCGARHFEGLSETQDRNAVVGAHGLLGCHYLLVLKCD